MRRGRGEASERRTDFGELDYSVYSLHVVFLVINIMNAMEGEKPFRLFHPAICMMDTHSTDLITSSSFAMKFVRTT